MFKKITAIIFFIIIFSTSEVFAKESEIKITCISNNNNKIIKNKKITGKNYKNINIKAPEVKGYYVVGEDTKEAVFNIDTEIKFYYTEKTNEYKTHKSYVKGYENNYFRPDEYITWAESLVMLYNISEIYKNNTDDKLYNSWYGEAYNYFIDIGFDEFFRENNFYMHGNIKKSEFINLAVLYIDNYADKFLVDAFLQLDNLDKTSNITRGESVWIINKFLNRDTEIDISSLENIYLDVDLSNPFYSDILEASIDHNFIKEKNKEIWIK